MEEATGSIPVSSTLLRAFELAGFTLAGFVAGEGCFSVTGGDVTSRRHVFAVDVATRDRSMLEALRSFLGNGSIYDQPARREGWQPMSQLRVTSQRAQRQATIPFASRFLLPCAKREQCARWSRGLVPLVAPNAEPDPAAVSAFLGGFAAAEGSFITSSNGRRFTFTVGLAAADTGMCELFRSHLGVGRIQWSRRRQTHYDDESTFVVGALGDLVGVLVPFMDTYLPTSHKRAQYLLWRDRLLEYWDRRARRVRTCVEPGCDRVRRAKGLCRRHYYVRYRR